MEYVDGVEPDSVAVVLEVTLPGGEAELEELLGGASVGVDPVEVGEMGVSDVPGGVTVELENELVGPSVVLDGGYVGYPDVPVVPEVSPVALVDGVFTLEDDVGVCVDKPLGVLVVLSEVGIDVDDRVTVELG